MTGAVMHRALTLAAFLLVGLLVGAFERPAWAQATADAGAAAEPRADEWVSDAPVPLAPAPAPAADAGAPTTTPSGPTVHRADSPARASSLTPSAAEAPTHTRGRFDAEPVQDGAIVSIAVGFAGLLELINSTGEITPQQIAPGIDRGRLLPIDRDALSQTIDPNAATWSNIGLLMGAGFGLVDPVLTGIRESNVQSALVDGIIYAESLAITWGVTNLTKLAVRRPRPRAYILAEEHKDDPTFSNTRTDSALSFFSGHSAIVAAASSTATYLAFARSPGTARPWVTLVTGVLLTSFVGYERVRSGSHFPTDVIAGAMAGAGIGILVPHLHRADREQQRPLWVGFSPEPGGGGSVTVGGRF